MKKIYRCKKCNVIYHGLKNYKVHLMYCQANIMNTCKICSVSFISKEDCELHVKKSHPQCEHCMKHFIRKKQLKDHMKSCGSNTLICHEDMSDISEEENHGRLPTSVFIIRYKYVNLLICGVCRRYIRDVRENLNHGSNCKRSPVAITDHEGNILYRSRYICIHCGKVSWKYVAAIAHKAKCTYDYHTTCQFCEMSFNNMLSYVRHLCDVHSNTEDIEMKLEEIDGICAEILN